MKLKVFITLLLLLGTFKPSIADENNTNLTVYTGVFDTIDKEGDDQTSLLGVEHRNTELFRDTFLGKLSPLTGAFLTGNNSVYLYTGVEGQYGVGPIKILPSFSPGPRSNLTPFFQ